MSNINLLLKQGIIAITFALSTAFSWSCCDDESDDNYVLSNQEFIARMSSANSFGLSAGVMAASKGQNSAVKQYGDRMVSDYTAAVAAFNNLALQKKWSIPTEIMANDEANLSALNASIGIQFDREYAGRMVAFHQEMLNLFTEASAAGGVPDVDLRVMAAVKLRIFKAYLEETKALQTAVN